MEKTLAGAVCCLGRLFIRDRFKMQLPVSFRLLASSGVDADKIVVMPGGQGGSGLTDFIDDGIIHGVE